MGRKKQAEGKQTFCYKESGAGGYGELTSTTREKAVLELSELYRNDALSIDRDDSVTLYSMKEEATFNQGLVEEKK